MEMDTGLVLGIDGVEEQGELASRTYSIDFSNGKVNGMVDGLEAVEQAITKILLTERYKNLIYSANYGCEIMDTMMGEENTDAFLEAEIPELIKDALLGDERILDVDNFEFYELPDAMDMLMVTFEVLTVFGKLSMEKVVA